MKISVLLPVYKKDSIAFLKKSIGSILGQTLQDFHIFVGIDGPIGDELQEALNKTAQDERVELVPFEENRGLACVLNDLVALSKKMDMSIMPAWMRMIYLCQNASINR